MELIDKAAVVAEIEKRKTEWQYGSSIEAKYKHEECDDILSSINTLEVKDVDLEKELVDYHNDNFSQCYDGTLLSSETGSELTWYDYECIAKHFFELGIQKAQRGE